MRHSLIAVISVGLLLASSVAVAAAPRNGVGTGPAGPVIGNAHVYNATPGSLNFDDVSAPCLFLETVALRSYGGLTFEGNAPLDGGAILNECGGFGVTGYSPPNFLAFNCGASMSDGGIPRLPQKMHFASEVNGFTLHIAGDVGATVAVAGRGSQGNEIHRLSLTSTMQAVTFTKPVVDVGVGGGTACIVVIDDLSWQ